MIFLLDSWSEWLNIIKYIEIYEGRAVNCLRGYLKKKKKWIVLLSLRYQVSRNDL